MSRSRILVASASTLVLLSALVAMPSSASATPLGDVRGCTITGTDGPDILKGTGGPDVICGLGGDDVLMGRGGDDVLYGGSGNDRLYGGTGDDKLGPGPGSDVVVGGPGTDSDDQNLADPRDEVPFSIEWRVDDLGQDAGAYFTTRGNCTRNADPSNTVPFQHGRFNDVLLLVDFGTRSIDHCATTIASARYRVGSDAVGYNNEVVFAADAPRSTSMRVTCTGFIRCDYSFDRVEGFSLTIHPK